MIKVKESQMLFEVGIKYDKTMDDGEEKKVKELYIVDASSFSNAESSIIKEMTPYIRGEFDVVSEKISNCKTFLYDPDVNADTYYKAQVKITVTDEKTKKEKNETLNFLVQANNIGDARVNVCYYMNTTMHDWSIKSLKETKIIDVYLK